mgnify:CR=1 FL=1
MRCWSVFVGFRAYVYENIFKNNIMSNNGDKKLTSVKIDPQLWDLFKIECIKRKFSFQKLSERAIDLYMKDEDFRRKVTNHSV